MLFFLFLVSTLCTLCNTQAVNSTVSVSIKNGTINGRHLAGSWDQDFFLGIPYAQPPVGSLRFKRPRSFEAGFLTPLDASKYGSACFQRASILTPTDIPQSEDCLTLNVIRPHGASAKGDLLPVLVWIYGGGFFAGTSADPQYNLSGIVHTADGAGKPIIAVSFNYRLGAFGFFQTPQLFASGDSNAGLHDQRLALRWIKENIAAFGGDPGRVTVWGESSGAQSIALHLHSYGGRDEGLFQAAVLESGGFSGTPLMPPSYYTSRAEELVNETGCGNASDQLECLRLAPANAFFDGSPSKSYWNPIVDGDFLTDYPSVLAQQGRFAKIPLLIGANSDEGISFSPRAGGPGQTPLDNSTDIFNALMNDLPYSGLPGLPYQLSPATAKKLLDLYPINSTSLPPYDVPSTTIFPANGLQWRRSAAIYGDLVMVAVRRRMASEFAHANQSVYSYRFATRAWNAAEADGVPHFSNVVFSFQNISWALGPLPEFRSHKDLSTGIARAYVNFAYHHDPNQPDGKSGLPYWPRWTVRDPVNMVLNATKSEVERDDFRREGMMFIDSIARELLA